MDSAKGALSQVDPAPHRTYGLAGRVWAEFQFPFIPFFGCVPCTINPMHIFSAGQSFTCRLGSPTIGLIQGSRRGCPCSEHRHLDSHQVSVLLLGSMLRYWISLFILFPVTSRNPMMVPLLMHTTIADLLLLISTTQACPFRYLFYIAEPLCIFNAYCIKFLVFLNTIYIVGWCWT